MKLPLSRAVLESMRFALCFYLLYASLARAEGGEPRQFVVTRDVPSGTMLSESQTAAAASDSRDSLEYPFGVPLQEEFCADERWYEMLTAKNEQRLTEYFAALNVTPIEVIEAEFTNGPVVGGGSKAGDLPKEGHRIYVIERNVPGISGLPLQEQEEISQGSQSVVAQFGDSLEWDRSYLTREGTFCVYRADDESKIREHAEIAGFPADRISTVQQIARDYNFDWSESV